MKSHKGADMDVSWNPWHGCKKISEGCRHCYVYRTDEKHGRDGSLLSYNKDFDLPVRRKKNGEYKVPSGAMLFTCFTSDFLLDEADERRREAWQFMRERSDVDFIFFTKRITRLAQCLPEDWGDGYDNVIIGCTCENQKRADERLPVFLSLPIKHRLIVCAPLLESIDLSAYLDPKRIESISAGGESGNEARICSYDWILSLRRQCVDAGVSFTFHQTGARFLKDGRLYRIKRPYQKSQARKADIDYTP